MNRYIHGGDIYTNNVVLDFSSNVNPLGTPGSVIKAAAESLKNAAHYPDAGNTALLAALCGYEDVKPENIIPGNGAAELIFTFVRALKPKKALIFVPSFAEYGRALRSEGCDIIKYTSGDFYIHEDILSCLTDDIDAVFLCNPNNPTGFLICENLLKEIVYICRKNGIYLLLDECFLDFTEGAQDLSMKSMLAENDRLFILKSFTKRYAMAGLRLGYGLCSDHVLLERMHASMQPWNISLPAQTAGAAALKEEEYVNAARRIVNEQRECLKSQMEETGLQVFDSKANFIFFKGPEGLYESCLERGILIRDCSNYDGLCRGYYRIAVRTEPENEILLDAFRDIIYKLIK